MMYHLPWHQLYRKGGSYFWGTYFVNVESFKLCGVEVLVVLKYLLICSVAKPLTKAIFWHYLV